MARRPPPVQTLSVPGAILVGWCCAVFSLVLGIIVATMAGDRPSIGTVLFMGAWFLVAMPLLFLGIRAFSRRAARSA